LTYTCTWEGKAVSENRRLIKARGRFISNPDYKIFLTSMKLYLQEGARRAGWKMLTGDCAVTLEIICPARMDHHNLEKPALDALQLAGILGNDRSVVDVRTIRMRDTQKGERSVIKFEVTPADGG
jgi:hypothetical protein